MLVLERRPGQTLCIGDDIRVTILRVKAGGHVRIGIEAPKDVIVDREEIWARRMAEQRGEKEPR